MYKEFKHVCKILYRRDGAKNLQQIFRKLAIMYELSFLILDKNSLRCNINIYVY